MRGAEHGGAGGGGRGIVRKIIPAAVTVLALVSVVAAAPLAAGATTPRAATPPARPAAGPVRPARASDWNNLYSVACPGRDTCVAVGGQSSGALAEVWNGTAWRIVTVPEPKGGTSSLLNSVSCLATNECTAVGYYYVGSTQLPLAEVWNGTAWRVQAVPAPPGEGMTSLNGVSCTSRTACAAVGWYVDGTSVLVTLAEMWNGTRWKFTPTPNPSGRGRPGFVLNGVSCTAADACRAVGDWEGFTSGAVGATVAEVWNGTMWKLQPIPNPKSYGGGILQGVSCTGTGSCTAVGNYATVSDNTVALAEDWTGKAWAIRAVPDPPPARTAGNYLNGVSCHATAACVAVGEYLKLFSDTNVALAERWDGRSWKQLSPVTPKYRAILEAVVCPRADRCVGCGAVLQPRGGGFHAGRAVERHHLDRAAHTQSLTQDARSRRRSA